MNAPTFVIALVGGLLLMAGGLIWAIDGQLSLLPVSLMWVGLMVALFLLYVRFEQVKRALGGKSARYGANMVVMTLVFCGVILLMASLGAAHKNRYDLTKTGRYTLSSQTEKLLKTLSTDVEAVAFYRSEAGTMHAQQKQTARDLLEEYAGVSPRFTFRFIDPDRNPGLASRYGVSEYRIILFMAGGKQVKVGAEKEAVFTNGLIKLLREKQKFVYFVKGQGEADLASSGKNGYSAARDAILSENYEIKELFLMRVEEVPDDASLVVMASPSREPSPDSLAKLDRYFAKGGALFVTVDPGGPPGFKTWIESHGFKLQNDVIIDQQSKVYGANPLTPVVSSYHKKHPLTADFTLATYFAVAHSVYIDEDPQQGRYQLAFTGPNSWTEMDREQLESGSARYDDGREKRGPVPLMAVTTVAAATEPDPQGGTRTKYGKMIVVGDSDFANNTNINLAGNGDLFMNTVNWLAEEADLIAVRAKKKNVAPVILTAAQGRAIFWIPVVMTPLTALLVGVGFYGRRVWFR